MGARRWRWAAASPLIQGRSRASGPDNALWFGEYDSSFGSALGSIGTDGASRGPVTVPAVGKIASGPDGGVWFTMGGKANAIGEITKCHQPLSLACSGAIPIPTPDSQPYDVTAGPNGENAVYFTEYAGNRIGRVTTGVQSTVRLEAESFTGGGHVVRDLNAAVTSGGSILRFDAKGETATQSFDGTASKLRIVARGGKECTADPPHLVVQLDGSTVLDIADATGYWRHFNLPVSAVAGSHTITLVGPAAGCGTPRFDYIEVVP